MKGGSLMMRFWLVGEICDFVNTLSNSLLDILPCSPLDSLSLMMVDAIFIYIYMKLYICVWINLDIYQILVFLL